MSSKVFLLFGLLLATGLLISSNLAARDLVEASTDENKDATTTTTTTTSTNTPQDQKVAIEDSTNIESEEIHPQQGGGGGGGGGGGYGRCRYGCCKYGYHGCIRCCHFHGQEAEAEAKPGN